MHLSNTRLTETVIELLERLQQRSDLPQDVAYDLGIAASALAHTHQVNGSDGAEIRDYAGRAAALAAAMAADDASGLAKPLLDRAQAAAAALAASHAQGDAAKQALTALLAETEAIFAQLAQVAPDAALTLFAAHAPAILALHTSLPLFGAAHSAGEQAVAAAPVSAEALTAYFRATLDDPAAQVSQIHALPGGFGKETVLFTLASAALNADLVIRRDPPIDPLVGLDCHSAPTEYPLLQAVHARGFPAPEPLFFADSTPHIPGGAFSIMRRAPGKAVGTALGGAEKVAADLQATLAGIVARLHNVPPLPELGDNPVFAAELWTMSVSDCTRAYIARWHRQFTATDHSAAPSLQALFHWLLARVPVSDAATTLVHGDIGFHNLLFDEGRLSAVLDWEFGHVGDPAEDLGYIRSGMGDSLDWPAFLAAYAAGGRPIPDERRIRFFEIWSHARNAAATVMLTGQFDAGCFRDVKFALLAMRFVPHFMARAHALVTAYERDFGPG
jgi:aminoglycoside phosphotransferase (APT) family kinase protein